jgi:hypothetical protein
MRRTCAIERCQHRYSSAAGLTPARGSTTWYFMYTGTPNIHIATLTHSGRRLFAPNVPRSVTL